jgi:hypothetical protein
VGIVYGEFRFANNLKKSLKKLVENPEEKFKSIAEDGEGSVRNIVSKISDADTTPNEIMTFVKACRYDEKNLYCNNDCYKIQVYIRWGKWMNKIRGYTCSCCGEYYDELPTSYGTLAPAYYEFILTP